MINENLFTETNHDSPISFSWENPKMFDFFKNVWNILVFSTITITIFNLQAEFRRFYYMLFLFVL